MDLLLRSFFTENITESNRNQLLNCIMEIHNRNQL